MVTRLMIVDCVVHDTAPSENERNLAMVRLNAFSRLGILLSRSLTLLGLFLLLGLAALSLLEAEPLLLHSDAWALEIVDDSGRLISLDRPARRIIPLYGAFAEMIYAINGGARVVARTQADQFPPEIKNLPSVGTHMKPNVEMILGLKPDLVVVSATRGEASVEADRLREAGVAVASFRPRSFEEIFSVMKRIGALTELQAEAEAAVGGLEKRLLAVKERLAGAGTSPRVFFEVRAEPLTGAGRGSIIQSVLEHAGAENVLKSDKAIVRYNFEALLLDNPDIYIIQEGPMNRNPAEPKQRPHFDRLKAVSEGKVLRADEFVYSRPGPRCVEAVEQLAAKLHPDRFGAGKP